MNSQEAPNLLGTRLSVSSTYTERIKSDNFKKKKKDVFVCLEELRREETERSSACWFTPKMATTAKAGAGPSQELGCGSSIRSIFSQALSRELELK